MWWWQLLLMVATAALSSLLTLALAYYVFDRRIRPDLEKQLDETLDELGADIEARVRRGVRDGVRDGVASLPSAEVIERATRTAARSSVDLLGGLLGRPAARRRDDE
ncbi:MAG: hypothetical protein AAFX50_17315 [Acidobacteriota bacterium]